MNIPMYSMEGYSFPGDTVEKSSSDSLDLESSMFSLEMDDSLFSFLSDDSHMDGNIEQILDFLGHDIDTTKEENEKDDPKKMDSIHPPKSKLKRSLSCSSIPNKLLLGTINEDHDDKSNETPLSVDCEHIDVPIIDQVKVGLFPEVPKLVSSHQNILQYDKKKYMCSICLDVYKRPVSLPCRHTFCRSCLMEASPTIGNCPLCRSEQSLDPKHNVEKKVLGTFLDHQFNDKKHKEEEKCIFDDYLSPDDRQKALNFRRNYQCWRRKFHYGARGEFGAMFNLNINKEEREFKKLEPTTKENPIVKVVKGKPQCKEVTQLDQSNRDICATLCGVSTDISSLSVGHFECLSNSNMQPIPCPYCSLPVAPSNILTHATSCSIRMFNPAMNIALCPNGCGELLSGPSLQHHLSIYGSCPNTIVPCPFSYSGCTVCLPRNQIQDHITDPYAMQIHIGLHARLNKVGIPIQYRSPPRVSQPPLRSQVKADPTYTNASKLRLPCWESVKTTNSPPSPRYDHGIAVYGKKMFVIGGVTGAKRDNDLHILDFNSPCPSWITPVITGEPPAAGFLHQAVVIGHKMYVIGGSKEGKFLSDIRVLNLQNDSYHWESPTVRGNIPSIRYWHSCSAVGNKIYLFGGYSGGSRLNDVHVLTANGKELRWSELQVEGTRPSIRSSHSASVVGTKIFIFGGYDGKGRKNDIHILDVTCKPRWIQPDVFGILPSVRYNHTCTAIGSRLYVFGGNSGSLKNDLHVLELSKNVLFWSQPKVLGKIPSVRYWHSLVGMGSNAILFGGYSGAKRENDVHCLLLSGYNEVEIAYGERNLMKKRKLKNTNIGKKYKKGRS